MRADRRDTLRAAVFFLRTPLVTPRMISGCAACRAACAALLSPVAMVSSTFFTHVRMRLRRLRFTAVCRSVCRTRFFAEAIFAMIFPSSPEPGRVPVFIAAPAARQPFQR